jgi:hypothetical protein
MSDSEPPPDRAADRLARVERWRVEHEVELQQRAESKRAEREARRNANRVAHWERVDSVLVEQAALSAERKAEKSEAWAVRSLPVADPFVVEMAAKFRHTERTGIPGYEPGAIGCTPQEFIDWQGRQRDLMRSTPSLAEQLASAPVIGKEARR